MKPIQKTENKPGKEKQAGSLRQAANTAERAETVRLPLSVNKSENFKILPLYIGQAYPLPDGNLGLI